MESLGYMMLYFLRGRVPWHTLRGDSKEQTYQLIIDREASIGLNEFCSDAHDEFTKHMEVS
jgi:hypothetical protein